MKKSFFTSESVSRGHPDKVADQISDKVLDAFLEQDPHSRVAIETLITKGVCVLAGEVSSNAHVDYEALVQSTLFDIGYTSKESGFDFSTSGIVVSINKQSPDIARGILSKTKKVQGAGDQGIMFGFAIDESFEFMPLPHVIATKIMHDLEKQRKNEGAHFLLPDAKTQVTVEYDEKKKPKRIDTIVLSCQHSENMSEKSMRDFLKDFLHSSVPNNLLDGRTKYYINPTGRFVIGGPLADTGVTGRKQIVDTYGGMARHGGGAFSGKDPTKVDRSGAYLARYIAKNIVAAKLATVCEVQLAYAIGISHPVSLNIDTFKTNTVDESQLVLHVQEIFDLSCHGIISTLDLLRPIYFKTSWGGHFGRKDPDFTWEKLDKVSLLKNKFL